MVCIERTVRLPNVENITSLIQKFYFSRSCRRSPRFKYFPLFDMIVVFVYLGFITRLVTIFLPLSIALTISVLNNIGFIVILSAYAQVTGKLKFAFIVRFIVKHHFICFSLAS